MDSLEPASSGSTRRFVIFIGPPKTASTALEKWLDHYARGENKTEAFANWDVPLFFGHPNGLLRLRDRKAAHYKLARKTLQLYAASTKNLLVGTEAFIQFDGQMNGILNTLHKWINYNSSRPEIVIQHRIPKVSHLISVWKQQTASKIKKAHGFSFRKYICHRGNTNRFVNRLAHDLNSVGMAAKLVDPNGKRKLPTYLVDMSGIQKAEMDVCHAFACQVLRVNCTSSYLVPNSENDPNERNVDLTYGQQWVQGLAGRCCGA